MMRHASEEIADVLDAAFDADLVDPTALGEALEALGIPQERAHPIVERVQRSRRELVRLRRREHELSELFSSARALAEQRDVDAVLARLVQRAREMMGVDVAYLSEFDPATRELRVRETDGSVSASFQRILVPPGRGLASVVVETRSAQWAADYAAYERGRHDESIDDAVAAEGLVSLLGVPMLTSDDVLGVLFVANRETKEFAPEEIAMLSAVADHASVLLQTAQMLHDLRESEERSSAAVDRLTAHITERDRANAVHQELVQAVLAGGGFSPVAETLAAALARSVVIVGANERVIAAAGLPLAAEMLEPDERIRAAIAESRRSGHCVTIDASPVTAVAALTAGKRLFGALLFGAGDFPLGSVDLRTIERAAQVGALLELQQEAASGADHRIRSDLLADLLDDVPERRADVERRARHLAVDLAGIDALLLLSVPGDQQANAAGVLSRQLDDDVLVGEYGGFVVAAYDSSRSSLAPEALRAHVAESIGHEVTAVAPRPGNGSVVDAFEPAKRTARLVTALGITGITASVTDFLPYLAVFDTAVGGLETFLDEMIGAVRRYDDARDTDLMGTLRAFVKNDTSPTRTARALNFHTNTILQRLDRLDQVLGVGWRDEERLFRIGIAVRLDELRERLRARR